MSERLQSSKTVLIFPFDVCGGNSFSWKAGNDFIEKIRSQSSAKYKSQN